MHGITLRSWTCNSLTAYTDWWTSTIYLTRRAQSNHEAASTGKPCVNTGKFVITIPPSEIMHSITFKALDLYAWILWLCCIESQAVDPWASPPINHTPKETPIVEILCFSVMTVVANHSICLLVIGWTVEGSCDHIRIILGVYLLPFPEPVCALCKNVCRILARHWRYCRCNKLTILVDLVP